MGGPRSVEHRASRLVAWLAVLGLPLIAMSPWLRAWDTLGFHDWDAMAAHRELVRRSLVDYGELPLWNPYACGGFPGWGYVEGGTSLVSPWLVFYLTLPMSIAIRLEVLGCAWLGATGAYLAAARVTRDSAARIMVVSLFAVNGRWGLQTAAGHGWHLAYALTPWCFWAFDRARRRGDVGSHAILAALLAMLLYAGGIYPLPHTVLFLGVYAAVLAVAARSLRPLASLAVSGLASLGLCAPKLLPMLGTFARAPRTIESVEKYDARALWAALTSRQQGFYDRPAPIHPYGWHEWGSYIGILGVVLLVVGVLASVSWLRHRKAVALTASGLLLFVLGLGAFAPWSPWIWLHAHAPFFGSMHVPSRFLYPATLALALAAAPGLGALLVVVRRRTRRAWMAPLFAAFAAGVGVDVALVARMPMAQAMWMRPPDGIQPGPFRHVLDPPYAYRRRDWAGSLYLAMLGNTGVIRCYGTPPFAPRGAVPATTAAGLVTIERATEAQADPVSLAAAAAQGRGQARGQPRGQAEVIGWSPNGIVVALRDTEAGSMLVYDMNTDPGWRATVTTDAGSTESVADSHGDRVAVNLPSGASRVSFRYRAPGLVTGTAVLTVTVAIGLLLGVRSMRRSVG